MQLLARFDECPPGLFLWGGRLNLMTEYSEVTQRGEILRHAYLCSSGEAFWGGTNLIEVRNALKVQPLPEPVLDAVASVLKRDRDCASLDQESVASA